MKSVGRKPTPEQPEDVKQAIEGLITEIEKAGNQLADDVNAFLERVTGSSEPANKTEAQSVLHQLQNFSLNPESPEVSSDSTVVTPPVPAPAGPSVSKKEEVKQKGASWLKKIIDNAREDGSSKSSNPEPKA